MKTLFKVCSFIMLASGLISIAISTGILVFVPLSTLYKAVTIISYLIPGLLTFFTGLFGLRRKSYHLLITLGTLALMTRAMITFQGYNGIIPLLQYGDLLLPLAYTILVVMINHENIENDLKSEE